MSDDDLLALARAAGELLAAQLAEAQRASQGWRLRDVAYPLIAAAIDHALEKVSASGVWGPANRLASAGLWGPADRWIGAETLIRHARTKPRGYAGDYLMLQKICDQWRSADPLGNIFDEYFQAHAAPQAVRNRTTLVAGAITTMADQDSADRLHIVSLGSGPAIDIQRGLRPLSADTRRRVRVTLLDLDAAALDHATQRLAEYLDGGQIHPVRENLFRLPQRGGSIIKEPADLVCCTGFFDYLADADAAALLKTLWNWLTPAGRLLVFNFAPHNPSRAFMEWLGNWYLTYRDRGELQTLAATAGLPPACLTIAAEPLGVDLLIDARREE